MKSVLLSVRPQHVANILNGLKTLEIRKKFPSDYVGWVYIYCTKNGHLTKCSNGIWYNSKHGKPYDSRFSYYSGYEGKVVARFWCDKVECAYNFYTEELCQLACISKEELCKYAGGWHKTDDLLAIHITKLEIFDKPKEIKEFSAYCKKSGMECLHCKHYWTDDSAGYSIPKCSGKPLTRAPQSWCYVEI